jgi:lysophospholipase
MPFPVSASYHSGIILSYAYPPPIHRDVAHFSFFLSKAIVADSRPPNYFPIALNLSTVYIPLNSTVYEFNPFEFGSYDPDLAHFIELEYTGTNLFYGQPLNSTACVNGFDNVSSRPSIEPIITWRNPALILEVANLIAVDQFGFVIGTSSSLFNAIIQTANSTLLGIGDGSGIVENLLDGLLADIGADLRNSEDDLAIYPNPFYGINEGTFPRANDDGLQLVDGGEAGAK